MNKYAILKGIFKNDKSPEIQKKLFLIFEFF